MKEDGTGRGRSPYRQELADLGARWLTDPQNARLLRVWMAYYAAGSTQAEIAAELGVCVRSVSAWLRQARQLVRERLLEEDPQAMCAEQMRYYVTFERSPGLVVTEDDSTLKAALKRLAQRQR